MNKEQEIAMLEKRLKELRAKGEVRKKVGFVGGVKRSLKIFGNSASTVFKSLSEADGMVMTKEKPQLKGSSPQGNVMNVDDVIKRLPA